MSEYLHVPGLDAASVTPVPELGERFAAIIESLPDAILCIDRDWYITYANPEAIRISRLQPELFPTLPFWDQFPDVRGTEMETRYRRAMATGYRDQFEFYYGPFDVWVNVHILPTDNGFALFYRDISEEKGRDETVQQQQDLLAAVQEVARLATWELDYSTGKIVYGPGSFEILGLPLSEVGSLDDRERFFLPGHAVKYRAAIHEAIRTRTMMVHEFAVHAADGSILWIESRGQLVPGTEARPRLRGMSIDVTQRKLDEQDLVAEQVETERRRTELETIYRTTPIGLALLDPVDFKFINLNDHEAEMLGFPKDQLIGRPLREIAHPADVPGLMEMMQSVAEGHVIKDRHLEGELAARPGEHRYWRVNYSPVFNEDGSVRAISTASIEITNQKKAEAALIQSEKLAAVGRLASSISHEINNPLEAITNLLYLIAMDKKLPDELKGFVNMAQSELSRVSQIATQTLRFHRQAVAPTFVTAQELITAVARLYTGRLANSHIRVDSRYDTDTQILCFENDIRQVLNNLIANAIDAMRNGGRLMIRAHNATSNGIPGVRITIADTGHGMNAATLARIFEPFFTTKDLNGTGLGLWISTGIVERHQGHLRVRSTDDPIRHGTIFTLFLPCKEVET